MDNVLISRATRLGLVVCGVLFVTIGVQAASLEGSSSGIFINPSPPDAVVSGVGTDFFTWGIGFQSPPSSLAFAGTTFSTDFEEVFSFGTLTFFNGTLLTGAANSVDLQVTIALTMPSGISREFTQTLTLINTPNVGTPEENADIVFLPSSFPDIVFTVDDIHYTLTIIGFGSVDGEGFASTIDRFLVREGATATAQLLGRVTTTCVVPEGGTISSVFVPIPDSCPPQEFGIVPTFERCQARRDFNDDGFEDCLLSELSDAEGNKFQLWCMKNARFFGLDDFYWYNLSYVPKGRDPKFAGKCPFEGGENDGFAFVAKNADGKNVCFLGSRWTSLDRGFIDDDLDGKLDWWVYRFDVASFMTRGTHFESSDGPGGTVPDTIADTFAQDPGPVFNDLPPVLDLEAIPVGAPMNAEGRIPCDLDRDGDCDGVDNQILDNALGACAGQNGYNSFADFDGNGCVTALDLQLLPTALPVNIDIKPGSYPNSISPESKGVVPVAILTTDIFDATTIDALSVQFGPGAATEAHGQRHLEDADGDGDLDLVLHFNIQESGLQCGDGGASLIGETFGGQAIQGSDSIVTVGCD